MESATQAKSTESSIQVSPLSPIAAGAAALFLAGFIIGSRRLGQASEFGNRVLVAFGCLAVNRAINQFKRDTLKST